MIVYLNVCDHCGCHNEINKPGHGFEIRFCVNQLDKIEHVGTPTARLDSFSVTFCNKECMISYFNKKFKNDGEFMNDESES